LYKIKPKGWVKHLDFITLDVFCLIISFILAYISRMGLGIFEMPDNYLEILIFYIAADIVILIYDNTFHGVLNHGYDIELGKTIKHVIKIELIVVFFMFLRKISKNYSRIIVCLIGIFYVITSYATRIFWKKYLLTRKKSPNMSSLYIVTTNSNVDILVQNIQEKTHGRYKIKGICITDDNCKGQSISGVEVTSAIEDVTEYLCREWVDEVFISVPSNSYYLPALISDLTSMGIIVHQEISYSHDMEDNIQVVEKIAGKNVLTIGINAVTYKQAAIKRIIDIRVGLVGCFVTLVLTIIIGPIIYINSPGSIFFSQTRIGRNGKKFKMYKFRSMYLDAEERKAELMKENRVKDGMMFKLDFDPRIIGAKKMPDGTIRKGIGNYIRDWSLDEFPQFWNVLNGTMSFVGTRPPTEDEWNKYELHHRARLAFKPGITGMWQVSGRSNITDFEDVVMLDKYYIQNWSIGLDFKIMLQTIKVVLGKEGSM